MVVLLNDKAVRDFEPLIRLCKLKMVNINLASKYLRYLMHAICGACPHMASLRGPGRSGRALTRHTYLHAGLIVNRKVKIGSDHCAGSLLQALIGTSISFRFSIRIYLCSSLDKKGLKVPGHSIREPEMLAQRPIDARIDEV